jgi:prepilin-type N-terminal cleavage/methylation domain-containing protein
MLSWDLSQRVAPRQNRGFTLVEMMVAIAILGIIMGVVALVNRNLATETTHQQTRQLLQSESVRIFAYLKVELQRAGNGVTNKRVPAAQSIFAQLDGTNSPWVIFFARDNGTVPNEMDTGDTWKKISLDDGAIREQVFTNSDNWLDVKNNVLSIAQVSTKVHRLSDKAAKIDALEFNYYDSNQLRIIDGYPVSYIRINLVLRKNKEVVKRNEWILLKNVVFGRTSA